MSVGALVRAATAVLTRVRKLLESLSTGTPRDATASDREHATGREDGVNKGAGNTEGKDVRQEADAGPPGRRAKQDLGVPTSASRRAVLLGLKPTSPKAQSHGLPPSRPIPTPRSVCFQVL